MINWKIIDFKYHDKYSIFNNVIYSIRYEVEAKDVNGNINKLKGEQPLDLTFLSPFTFVDINNLDEDKLINWVHNSMAKNNSTFVNDLEGCGLQGLVPNF